jgi:predicted enzyme related to lactoylglutathione lyase
MENYHINYVEFKAQNLEAIKEFYTKSFNWKFTDYGPDYVAFSEAGLEGGFEKTDLEVINGTLIVLYHSNLEEAKSQIIASGGEISIDIFDFPGGRRFHFIDPAGNELAVWSDN